ncbi:MAG: deoxyribonuclease IV [Bacteroidota bacterium]
MLLGVHCSISGGVHNACEEAASLGIDAFQIFTKNQRQWKEKQFTKEEQDKFKTGFNKANIKIAFSHASYLVNLANPDKVKKVNAIRAMVGEVQRCHDLGLKFTILHPGFPKELSEHEGIKNIAEALKEIIDETNYSNVMILLENMAGQGSSIGRTFEHLREIMDMVSSERIGACFDTCHAFAAGYDIRTKGGFEDTMEKWDKIIGLQNLKVIHLNDSKADLGSRVDRHEHIGKGKIGIEPFKQIMKQFPDIPKVLETPKEKNMDEVNLKVLREFI